MSLFATLLLGHLLGDFLLQTNWVFEFKTRSWIGIALHTAIHLVVTALLIQNWWDLRGLLALLGILHFTIDWVKIRYSSKSQTFDFLLDQLAHLVVIILFTMYWSTLAQPMLPEWMVEWAIYYAAIPACGIFIWVMALELVLKGYGHIRPIRWLQSHLLQISQYAGIPLLILLCGMLIFFAMQTDIESTYSSFYTIGIGQ